MDLLLGAKHQRRISIKYHFYKKELSGYYISWADAIMQYLSSWMLTFHLWTFYTTRLYLKQTLRTLLFDILNTGDDYIDTPTLVKK